MALKFSVLQFIFENRLSGKRQTFMLNDDALSGYIDWAFSNDCLLLVSSENGITGVAVAYPLEKGFDGTVDSLLIFDEPPEIEHGKELVVMDWIATNPDARRDLVKQFKKRFWNWENQKKWGIHYGKVKELKNSYLNKLETY